MVLPLHNAAGMLPVDRTICETPLLATALEPPPGVRKAGHLLSRIVTSWQFVTAGILFPLLLGFLIPPRHVCFGESKVDIAKLTVTKYANEAYPQWRTEHPTLECPRSLRELDRYMDKSDHRDPWGVGYVFTCGGGRLYAMSLGEDGRGNTADDIWSHQ